MPYYLTPLDETRHIFKLQLVDPLSGDEVRALRDEALALYDQPGPLYLLVDLTHFSWRHFPSLEGEPALEEVEPRGAIGVALLGSGPLIGWLVNHIFRLTPAPPVQAFDYEDQAYTWLSSLADEQPA